MAAQTPPPASHRVFFQSLASTSLRVHRLLCSPYPLQQQPPQIQFFKQLWKKNGHQGSIIGISGSFLDSLPQDVLNEFIFGYELQMNGCRSWCFDFFCKEEMTHRPLRQMGESKQLMIFARV